MNRVSKATVFRDVRLLALSAGLGLVAVLACSAPAAVPVAVSQPNTNAFSGSASCRECHPKFYELWSTSFHGLAMQPWTAELATTKLTPQVSEIRAGQQSFLADISRGVVIEKMLASSASQAAALLSPAATGSRQAGATVKEHRIVQVTGGKNVYYFLTALDRGRLQVLPVAYDVRRKEWFDTTASAMRHFGDQSDAPLHWTERPLTFNTSCYNCHVSQLEKNYTLKTDSYHTTWKEPGINCETCHGPSASHVDLFRSWPTNQPPPADIGLIVTKKLTTTQRNDMCAPCHAKMSPVTSSFAPGQRYFDHFDLVTLEDRDFYPDGRDLGENYTWTQWRMNPCAKSGQLDCMHCHTSSGRYRFTDPAKANDACLPCHQDKVANAPAHTRHKPDSKGNHCISCHMPMTEFARMRRSDHSMRPPAPAATLAFKSPNACNLCHTNDAAWADKFVREWRARDYQQPIVELGALIQAARKGDWAQLPKILAYLASPGREEVQSASLIRLLANCPDDAKWPVLRDLAADLSPLVRAAAAEALGARLDPGNVAALLKAVADDYRLVRVRAGAALAPYSLEHLDSSQRQQVRSAIQEYVSSLVSLPDDMASHYNLGNFLLARGELTNAVGAFETALRLQPDALPPYVNAALAYSAMGRNDQAEAKLRAALRLDPTNSTANLNLGMLLAELGKMSEAETAFRTAFKSDPRSAQAAYNLGVLRSKTSLDEAVEWCSKAAALAPSEARYPFTLAFYLNQKGNVDEAARTLEGVVGKALPHPDSYLLLGQIYERQGRRADAARVYLSGARNAALPDEARQHFAARGQALSRGGGTGF